MSFVSAQKSRLLLGDFSLSAYTKTVDGAVEVEMNDVTVLTSTAKEFQPGRDSATFSASGLLDVDGTANGQYDQLGDWKAATSAAEPITYGREGFALGAEVWMVGAFEASLKLGATVSGLATFDLSAEPTGPPDPIGRSLHDLVAVSADEDGSSYDGTAATANGGVGHLHVTAYSGLTSAAVKVQHSTNNSVWSDLITFGSVTAITSERAAVTGTVNRYLRYSIDVTGTGSITLAVAFARR